MDSEICIMTTSGCNKVEKWQKIGLIANNCEGINDSVIKKRQLINKFRGKCKFGRDMMQYNQKYYKMKISCIFNSLPNSMAELGQKRRKLWINIKVY